MTANSTPKRTYCEEGDVPTHPGEYIRDTILTPREMTVKKAAEIIGVGRPALSNFLNGKAALSANMAARIERAFNVTASSLLDMQSAFDAGEAPSKGALATTKSYVPPFLEIRAADIANWSASGRLAPRARLAVLLRTLVNSTGSGLKLVDFPGNDDSQRPGWDGFIDAEEATPRIPEGKSGWEFGTNVGVKSKADGDYTKSVKANSAAVRAEITFVFVTPHHWPGKTKWVEAQRAKGDWKDVRAYDSSDLEQWLEQSIAGQVWFADETQRPARKTHTLDKCWADWAGVMNTAPSGKLFAPFVSGTKEKLADRLSEPPQRPIVIVADSTDEALAYLSRLFDPTDTGLGPLRDRVVVLNEPGVFPLLAEGAQDFLAVTANRDVEREFGRFTGSIHTFVIYPSNGTSADPDIELPPLNYDAFREALEDMGFGRDRIDELDHESGRSLTVLRRRLSDALGVKTPKWAIDEDKNRFLVPFLLVGAWNGANPSDQGALSLLAGRGYGFLEKDLQTLLRIEDTPVWSVGEFRGVVSKIDLLFAIAHVVTREDLEQFFDLAGMVLSEDDPSLELPVDERWDAAFHGLSREFSSALRDGIAETLVLLSVHGNGRFLDRIGFDTETRAAHLVRDILVPDSTPLSLKTLEANDRDLPTYAEAGPDIFLSIIEEDLRADAPVTIELMQLAGSDMFGGGCPRSGLLWALEGLAWNPATLPRVVLILGRLARIEIEDNWANKPIASLESIFRAWMPQTAADHDQRLAALKLLIQRYSEIGWRICVDQFGVYSQTGTYNHKPRWRKDGHGFGEPFPTWGPVMKFVKEAVDIALDWKGHSPEMLGDLIERISKLDEPRQAHLWDLIKAWAETGVSDTDKAWVSEKIRVSVLTRRGRKRAKRSGANDLGDAARAARLSLEPEDLLNKHLWLFRDTWIDESADEIAEVDFDYDTRHARITQLRTVALTEIFDERGIDGIVELAEMGRAAQVIGRLSTDVLAREDIPALLAMATVPMFDDNAWARRNLVSGVLHALRSEAECADVLGKTSKLVSCEVQARLLSLAPFRHHTWLLADRMGASERGIYWKEVAPDWFDLSEDFCNEAVERLLEAERPRAAFVCVHYKLEVIRPVLLFRLLTEMASADTKDQPGHYKVQSYDIEKAFSCIDKSIKLSLEQKAGLEFAYIEVLSKPYSRDGFGIPNLEKYVEANPEFYVQAIVWMYKRQGGGEDPEELKVALENRAKFAKRGYRLLDAIKTVPGRDPDGKLTAESLSAWVENVRLQCAELDRRKVTDICLGEMLARAPERTDGVWPCEPVCDVMEDIQSEDMCRGAHTGRYNSRGVHGRGEGGDQERGLSDQYRRWADALRYSHPFVASMLLDGLADTYDREANQNDIEAGVRRRLR